MASDSPPHAEYSRRLESRRARVATDNRLHVRLGNIRLLLAGAAAALIWFGIIERGLPLLWIAVPVVLFIAIAVFHDRVLRRRAAAQRSVAYYRRGLDRLEGRWAGRGARGERFQDPEHPYADDLDLFGHGSVYELLSVARTPPGEETLAAWLKNPAELEEIRARQEAVRELREMLELREDMAILAEPARTGLHTEVLSRWGERPPVLPGGAVRLLTVILPALTVLSLILWNAGAAPRWFLLAAAAQASFYMVFRKRILHVVHAVEEPAHDLALLSSALERVERVQFQGGKLVALRAALEMTGAPPSRRIARLRRLVELLDSRDTLAIRLLGPLVLWTTQSAFAVEAWRRRSGKALRGWLDALGELEALFSLGGYAYEHPHDVFPDFTEEVGFFADALSHPLLPDEKGVRNDVRVSRDLPLLVVSGSNMSGKSTLLRTIGVNAVLAMAGAPVRAKSLRLSPLAVGASIRVTDSLQEGHSRFYAQIRRLGLLAEISRGPRPLLFLLDELLHGTNSHDRRIGAEAFLRSLVRNGAVGLITTHDLELAHIAEAMQPQGENVHFEDQFEAGQMTFDYKLRPGVVRKSNALELMRSVGLEV